MYSTGDTLTDLVFCDNRHGHPEVSALLQGPMFGYRTGPDTPPTPFQGWLKKLCENPGKRPKFFLTFKKSRAHPDAPEVPDRLLLEPMISGPERVVAIRMGEQWKYVSYEFVRPPAIRMSPADFVAYLETHSPVEGGVTYMALIPERAHMRRELKEVGQKLREYLLTEDDRAGSQFRMAKTVVTIESLPQLTRDDAAMKRWNDFVETQLKTPKDQSQTAFFTFPGPATCTPLTDLEVARVRLSASYGEAEVHCGKIGVSPKPFMKAKARLENPTLESSDLGRIGRACGLSNAALQLADAALSAPIWGGMGSWNDLQISDEMSQPHAEIDAKLREAVESAYQVAVNQSGIDPTRED